RFLQMQDQSIGGGLPEGRTKQLDEGPRAPDRFAIFVNPLDRALESGRRRPPRPPQNRLERPKEPLPQPQPSAQPEASTRGALAALTRGLGARSALKRRSRTDGRGHERAILLPCTVPFDFFACKTRFISHRRFILTAHN